MQKCKFSNDRLKRWITQDYDIKYEFIPGKENVAADVLSRCYGEDYEPLESKEISIYAVMMQKPSKKIIEMLKNIGNLQSEDRKLLVLKNKVKYETDEIIMKMYIIEDDLLKKKFKNSKKCIVIPENVLEELIKELHIMYVHYTMF